MLRFTIRDVLWLIVVVALAVGWLIDHRRQDGNVREHLAAANGFWGLKAILEDRGYQIEMTERSISLSGGAEPGGISRITLQGPAD